ncbi:MAG: flagellar hook assembly protein FlgD [Micropepsaceae bacterium]
MDVGAVATSAAQTTARTSLSGNFDTFLKLLTTQLQNQDPLEPMDATKFTEQLVSYSQVEQQINTNANLESLIALNKSAIGANAVTYLGKTVLTAGPATALEAGAAKWRYALTSDASTLQLTIKDASGKTVRTMTGDKNVGMHEFTWDGKNDAGVAQAAGTYTLTVNAKKSDGTAIDATVGGIGLIKEIDMSSASPMLTIGNRGVSLTDVLSFVN